MPVIVRELIIRATVSDNTAGSSSSGGSAGAVPGNAEEKESLVKEIIEQVLHIMEKKTER